MNHPFESPLERLIREAHEKQEAERRNKFLADLLSSVPKNNTYSTLLAMQPKRKVFISYHHDDDAEVKAFVKRWTETEQVFIPKGLGLKFTNDIINSDNPEYVMSQIRKRYIEDASVTIVLLGKCTHSRRYVDWEIKASLRQEAGSLANGLMGVILPSLGNNAYFPPRLAENWAQGHIDCYACCWRAPQSASELRSWIENAFSARTSKNHLIKNSSDMMKYNATCETCGIVHPA